MVCVLTDFVILGPLADVHTMMDQVTLCGEGGVVVVMGGRCLFARPQRVVNKDFFLFACVKLPGLTLRCTMSESCDAAHCITLRLFVVV